MRFRRTFPMKNEFLVDRHLEVSHVPLGGKPKTGWEPGTFNSFRS